MALAKRSHRFFKFRTLLVIRQPQPLFSNLFWFNLQYFSKYFLAHITNIPLYPLQGHSTFPRKYPYLFPFFFFFPLSFNFYSLVKSHLFFLFTVVFSSNVCWELRLLSCGCGNGLDHALYWLLEALLAPLWCFLLWKSWGEASDLEPSFHSILTACFHHSSKQLWILFFRIFIFSSLKHV